VTTSLPDEFPESAPGRSAGGIPIIGHMGLEVLHAERGRAVMRLPFEPNINHVGMVYAGSIFTLAEVPGGILFSGAFDVSRFYPIVGDMSVRFVQPAMTSLLVDARMSDDEIDRVSTELDDKGKAKWVLDQEVVDSRGQVVATTSATYFGLAWPTS
jgi:thioesterase domain-containing protein